MTNGEQPVEKVLITERPAAPADKTVIKTEAGKVEIVAMQWWQQVLIRAMRVYLQSLLGFILAVGTGAAQAVGVQIPIGDFGAQLLSASTMAIAPAVISLLQNSIEILTKLDSTTPQMRA